VFIQDIILSLRETNMSNLLTEHELLKRLDNEFYDLDFSVHDSPTKGTVAVVYFYQDKLENEAPPLGDDFTYTGGDSALLPDEEANDE
jgi:hypothetical protein